MTILKDDVIRNFRGRRFMLCRLLDDLEDIIDNLGVNETLTTKEEHILPSPPDRVKLELKNQATNLIRMLLTHNDGGSDALQYRNN